MISESCIYWITRLDNILSALEVIECLCAVVLLAFFLLWGAADITRVFTEKESEDYQKVNEIRQYSAKRLLPLTIAFALMVTMSILIPTSKELAAMYVIPNVANNERIQNFSSEIVTIAEDWLKELKTKSQGTANGERK